MLIAAGALICAGLGTWLYGSLTTSDSLVHDTRVIGKFSPLLKVHAYLDPDINPVGVILVEKDSFTASNINVRVIEPRGNELISTVVEGASVDEYFDIESVGTYTLVIRNDSTDIPVGGSIGYASEAWRLSLGPAGIVVLMVGTVWAVGVLLIILKNALK